jgi:surface antigen
LSEHKVNLQARIKRHSRILKDNLWNSLANSKKRTGWYKIVAMLLVLLFPIYPAFSYFWTTAESFYRWDIDESSILESYEVDKEWQSLENETLVESKDSFLSIWALVEDDNSSSNKMIEYNVIKWDTLKLIAQKYSVSEDTIIWANESVTKDTKILKEGIKLNFPPVTWIVYKVKRWDTVSGIAKKYWIYTKEIIAQNNIVKNNLKISQSLVIPGWKYIKEEVKKVYIKNTYTKKTYTKKPYYKKSYQAKTSYIAPSANSKWRFPLSWHKPQSWAWGNCTYYVASYKAVNWRWNANQWLRNARAKWHKTGNYAVNGSIIVLGWRWYNRWYWHVAIVREVHKDYLIVSDMNYRRLNQVTIRKIKRYWSHVRWYIYVN